MRFPILPVRVTAALIVLQLAVLVWTLMSDRGLHYAPFCSAGNDRLGNAFGNLHMAFLLALPLGLVSLKFRHLRVIYAIVLVLGLAALTQQRVLFDQGHLHCDAP